MAVVDGARKIIHVRIVFSGSGENASQRAILVEQGLETTLDLPADAEGAIADTVDVGLSGSFAGVGLPGQSHEPWWLRGFRLGPTLYSFWSPLLECRTEIHKELLPKADAVVFSAGPTQLQRGDEASFHALLWSELRQHAIAVRVHGLPSVRESTFPSFDFATNPTGAFDFAIKHIEHHLQAGTSRSDP